MRGSSILLSSILLSSLAVVPSSICNLDRRGVAIHIQGRSSQDGLVRGQVHESLPMSSNRYPSDQVFLDYMEPRKRTPGRARLQSRHSVPYRPSSGDQERKKGKASSTREISELVLNSKALSWNSPCLRFPRLGRCFGSVGYPEYRARTLLCASWTWTGDTCFDTRCTSNQSLWAVLCTDYLYTKVQRQHNAIGEAEERAHEQQQRDELYNGTAMCRAIEGTKDVPQASLFKCETVEET